MGRRGGGRHAEVGRATLRTINGGGLGGLIGGGGRGGVVDPQFGRATPRTLPHRTFYEERKRVTMKCKRAGCTQHLGYNT